MARSRVGRETRARILEATRALLGEAGLEGTTLQAICGRAAVGAGSFYNLFASKEAAVLSVVREAIEAVDPEGRGRVDPEGRRPVDVDLDAEEERSSEEAADHPPETVADLVDAYLRFLTREPGLARIYVQAAVAWGRADPSLAARFRRHQAIRLERFSAAIRRGDPDIDDGEVRRRAELLLAILYGLTLSWLLDPSIELDRHREALLDLNFQWHVDRSAFPSAIVLSD